MTTKPLVKFAGLFALCTAPIFAQGPTDLKVNIPFAFTVGHKAMPAGVYDIHNDIASAAINVRNENGKAATLALTFRADRVNPPKDSEVTFHVYGGKYYLCQVWNADAGNGREVPKSASEKESERAGIPLEVAVIRLVHR
jgi:hypothetical protein